MEVLIMSASMAPEDSRIADALRQGIVAVDPTAAVKHHDLLSLAPRWFRTAYGGAYKSIVPRSRRLWRGLHDLWSEVGGGGGVSAGGPLQHE